MTVLKMSIMMVEMITIKERADYDLILLILIILIGAVHSNSSYEYGADEY